MIIHNIADLEKMFTSRSVHVSGNVEADFTMIVVYQTVLDDCKVAMAHNGEQNNAAPLAAYSIE